MFRLIKEAIPRNQFNNICNIITRFVISDVFYEITNVQCVYWSD
jgi:hypothetical protein